MQQLSYIQRLDGIRALAIIQVLLWHYVNCQIADEANVFLTAVKYVTSFAWSGVDLFFVLSGFLIGRILMVQKNSKNYFKTFYLKRFFRIFPAYYFILITFILMITAGLTSQFTWLLADPFPFYAYGFCLQNFWMSSAGFGANWMGITWSLAIEEQFYLLLPLLVFFVKDKWLPYIFLAGICLAPFFRSSFTGLGAYVLLPARMDALLMGTMLAYFDLKGDLVRYFRGKQKLLYLILTLMLVCIFICFKAIPTEGFGGIYIHSYLVIFYGTLFILTLSSDAGTYLIQFLSNSLMAFIAKLSFMIYLSHQLFSGLLHQLILNQEPQLRNYKDLGVTSLALVMTIIFSSLSYRYFEKPILNYAKRFTYLKPSARNIKPET